MKDESKLGTSPSDSDLAIRRAMRWISVSATATKPISCTFFWTQLYGCRVGSLAHPICSCQGLGRYFGAGSPRLTKCIWNSTGIWRDRIRRLGQYVARLRPRRRRRLAHDLVRGGLGGNDNFEFSLPGLNFASSFDLNEKPVGGTVGLGTGPMVQPFLIDVMGPLAALITTHVGVTFSSTEITNVMCTQ